MKVANMQKFHASDMVGVLRHNYREVDNGRYCNPDIKEERRDYNMSYSPNLGFVEGKRYKAAISRYEDRREAVFCSTRKDLVTMAEWNVTLPREVWDMTQAINSGEPFPVGETLHDVEAFFQHTVDFLTLRYGKENVLAAEVHFDEGRRIPLQATNWDGSPRYERAGSGRATPVWKRDDDGKVIVVQGYGQPHLHFDFLPIIRSDDGTERFCAKELLDRRELRSFHRGLNNYLKAHGVKGEVINGATKDHNFTVEQLKSGLKAEYDLYKREYERNHSHSNNW